MGKLVGLILALLIPAAASAETWTMTQSVANYQATFIQKSQATTNFDDTADEVYTRFSDASGFQRRGLIKWNELLADSIPAGSTITSCTLHLFKFSIGEAPSANDDEYSIARLTQTWNESQVTWNNAATAKTWTSGGGGTFSTSDSLRFLAGDITNFRTATARLECQFEIKELAQAWLDGAPEYGLILFWHSDDDIQRWADEYQNGVQDADYCAYLTVEYDPPPAEADGDNDLPAPFGVPVGFGVFGGK